MPIEAALLNGAPASLPWCPNCRATPFTPFLRGQVQRFALEAPLVFLTSLWRDEPFAHCALICRVCKMIVGWKAA